MNAALEQRSLVMAIATNNLGVPMVLWISICLAVAILGGLINGVLISKVPAQRE